MPHRDEAPRLRARLTKASERRGEELVGRLGQRVTDSMARLHATTDWLQSFPSTDEFLRGAGERNRD